MNVYNLKGESIGEVKLPKEIFGIDSNPAVVHELVVAELASSRQGSASTKGRSEIRGGGRKPRPQKGTGRARQGSIRAPQWVGGGTVHGPKPRDFTKKINKKARKLALRSILSSKVNDGKFFVIDDYHMEKPETKAVVSFISKMSLGKPLFLLDDIFRDENQNFYYSTRNIKDGSIIDVYDLV